MIAKSQKSQKKEKLQHGKKKKNEKENEFDFFFINKKYFKNFKRHFTVMFLNDDKL